MGDSDGQPASDGKRALAISNAIGRLHAEYYGRGPSNARTIINGDYVITFLNDIYTRIERTLIDAGEGETVKTTRHAFQRAMEPHFIAAVEEIMDRKVIGFLSQVSLDPDLSQETFILEPQPNQTP